MRDEIIKNINKELLNCNTIMLLSVLDVLQRINKHEGKAKLWKN